MRGSVKQDSKGAWFYVIDNGTDPATGKRRQVRRRGFRTRKLAEKALGEVVRQAERGAFIEASSEPLSDFLTLWLKSIRPTVRASTWAGYSQKIESHVKPRIGGTALRSIDVPTLNAFYADLLADGNCNKNGKGLSAQTVSHVHKILHRALRDAVRWGKLTANPVEHAEPPRPVPVEMKVWSADQLRAFLEHVEHDRLGGLYVVAAMTGMRRGELLALRWADVDLGGAQIAVRRSAVAVGYDVIEGEPKSGRARTVAIDPATLATLKAHRKSQLVERLAWGELWTDSGLVFTREDGTAIHPHSLSRFFEHRAKAGGLSPIRFHDLRHTHATLGLAAGVPAKVMQERLGHANVGITLDLYTHVVPGMQEQAAATIGALVFGSVTNP